MPVGGQSIVGVGHRGQGRNVAIVVIQRVVVGGIGIGTRGQGRNVAIVVIQRVVVDGIGILESKFGVNLEDSIMEWKALYLLRNIGF